MGLLWDRTIMYVITMLTSGDELRLAIVALVIVEMEVLSLVMLSNNGHSRILVPVLTLV
jgi:hypothetical protein